jgi:predicted nuclease of restriction endonuclease-like RecB superfamily
MLRREHAIAVYHAGQVFPDRLTRTEHAHYVPYAERMLRVYRFGVGRTRRELHRAVWAVFGDEPDCPARRIEAFCKLLDDRSTYERDRRGKAARLRLQVFRIAAEKHPLVRRADRLFGNEEQAVKAQIAERLGRPWAEVDGELFADVIEFHRLKSFEGYTSPEALLARYNVAQVQAALYDAESMTVWASDDFKTILRYAKLARLMHNITRRGERDYVIRLTGPASVLRATRRYGAAMARFLPALVACRGWRMHAVIRTRRRGWAMALDLSSEAGLTSHLPPPREFDSAVEESFAAKWGSEKREGWQLIREGEILYDRQKVFVPDFVFHHDDGRTVLMEIVGFWTPEYLQSKLATLREFADHRILLAVASPAREAFPELSDDAIPYKSALRVQDVLDRLENA